MTLPTEIPDTPLVLPPSQKGGPWRFIIDHNPFYLLSALCMLGGCLALTNSLSWSPVPLTRILLLIGTLQIYEFLLIGIAVLLLRRQQFRDAIYLLMMEAAFLVDIAFVQSEIFSLDLSTGTIVNALLIFLAALKVMVLLGALGMRPGDGLYAFALAQVMVLYLIPGFFAVLARSHGGQLRDLGMYAGWWIAGMLPVLHAMIVPTGDWTDEPREDWFVGRLVRRTFVILPLVSLIAHLSTSIWVYKLSFYPAYVAPLLLGWAISIGHNVDNFDALLRRRMHFVLPLVAISLASMLRRDWPLSFELPGGLDMAPLRLTLVAASLVYLDGYWAHRNRTFLWLSGTCLACATFGASLMSMAKNAKSVGGTSIDVAKKQVPRTTTEWGVVSVVASFVLLGIGLLVSLLKEPKRERAN